MLRNLFVGYVLELQGRANTSIAVPLWVLAYYVNYLFGFLPIIGMCKTIVSYNYANY
jgi:hypothetical protein